MNIALMAHDNKKELMVQFCTAYCGILAQHTLCATANTGKQVQEATGLKVHRFLSFENGGGQQIAARASGENIDSFLHFKRVADVRAERLFHARHQREDGLARLRADGRAGGAGLHGYQSRNRFQNAVRVPVVHAF